jgi:predicted small secreted protein
MTITRLAALCAIICALFVASCANTVRGVSRDVKDTASAVEEAVQ